MLVAGRSAAAEECALARQLSAEGVTARGSGVTTHRSRYPAAAVQSLAVHLDHGHVQLTRELIAMRTAVWLDE